jgi:arginyl-tRNA synthetase
VCQYVKQVIKAHTGNNKIVSVQYNHVRKCAVEKKNELNNLRTDKETFDKGNLSKPYAL